MFLSGFDMSASEPVFRFAPSPNGYLHLGHAYSALYAAHWAERLGGRFLLRMEDIDPGRSKPEFAEAVLKDLAWLGLSWERPVLAQSTRVAAYDAAIRHLDRLGLVYACFCTRGEIAARATGRDPDGAPLYPGTCRHLDPHEVAARNQAGVPMQIRLDTAKAVQLAGMLTYSVAAPNPGDRPQIHYARPARWGDVVLKRKDAPASYHLAVVVDDAFQGVTHVTRGTDMEAATDIHVLLQMLLGLKTPLYTFHKLLLGSDGRKLSKSEGAKALRVRRAEGQSPEALRAELGF